jgi:hypothetical protein
MTRPYVADTNTFENGRLHAKCVRMRWAAATFLLTCLTVRVLAQENYLPKAAQPPSPSEQIEIIEKAREVALRYTDNLPNFIATETIRRQALPRGSTSWKARETLIVEVSFAGMDETYKLLTINGKPTTTPYIDLDGTFVGEFGSDLEGVFALGSKTKFEWQRWTNLRGRTVHVFSYRIEQDHSGHKLTFGDKHRGTLPYSGLLFVDRETHQVLRLTSAPEIPADWPVTEVPGEIDYGFVNVDGKEFLLPQHSEMRIVSRNGSQTRTLTVFSNYHKFSTGVTITPVN